MAQSPSFGEAGLQRRALFGLFPDDDTTTSSSRAAVNAVTDADTTAATTSTTEGGGGILGGLTSALGGITSAVGDIVPTTSRTSSVSSTTRAVSSTSSSSTSSLPTSTTSSSTTSSVVSTPTTSTSTSTTSTAQTTPEPVSQSEATTTYVSTSDNQVITITATLPVSDIAPSASETASTQGTQKSFLQNKPLSGTIFGLVGLVGLIILVVLSTWFVRRSRRNRLERDAEAFTDWPGTDGLGGAATSEKRDLTRTPSDRTARSNNRSDEALVGGAAYGHRQQLSDGTIRRSPPPMPTQTQMQVQQVAPGAMGTGMPAFNPLPAPPGLSGGRAPPPGPPPPGPPPPVQSYAYESPYAAYQQPAYMPPQQQANLQHAPSNGNVWSGSTFGHTQQPPQPPPQYPGGNVNVMPTIPQGRSSDGSSSPTRQGPPSVFGRNSNVGSGPGSVTGHGHAPQGQGIGQGQDAGPDIRASTGSDAYADYAFATGPGQNGSHPRNLTIANA